MCAMRWRTVTVARNAASGTAAAKSWMLPVTVHAATPMQIDRDARLARSEADGRAFA